MDGDVWIWIGVFVGGYAAVLVWLLRIALGQRSGAADRGASIGPGTGLEP